MRFGLATARAWFVFRKLLAQEPSAGPNLLVENLSKREIPSLYGLRGVAALVVVIYHYCLEWKLIDFPGYYSVTLFFELSGLLITWLMLKEIRLSGRVDQKQFYLRRSLRLFPVFYFVWGLCRLAGPFAGSWAYLLYLGDYFTAITGKYSVLTSAWSLGVEEKFYLLWPQLVVRAGLPTLTKVLAAILLIEPVYRHLLSVAGHEYYTHFAFDTNLDPIVLGCLIAVLAVRGWSPPKWMLHPVSIIVAAVAGVLFWRSLEIMMLVLGMILIYVVCRPPWWLNNWLVRFFGLISYSLYLCHEYAADVMWPFLLRTMRMGSITNPWIAMPMQILLAVGIAVGLHYAIERPFLRLKNRFHARGTSTAAVG